MLLTASIITNVILQEKDNAQCNSLPNASYWPCACQEEPQQKPGIAAKDTVCVQRDFS